TRNRRSRNDERGQIGKKPSAFATQHSALSIQPSDSWVMSTDSPVRNCAELARAAYGLRKRVLARSTNSLLDPRSPSCSLVESFYCPAACFLERSSSTLLSSAVSSRLISTTARLRLS